MAEREPPTAAETVGDAELAGTATARDLAGASTETPSELARDATAPLGAGIARDDGGARGLTHWFFNRRRGRTQAPVRAPRRA